MGLVIQPPVRAHVQVDMRDRTAAHHPIYPVRMAVQVMGPVIQPPVRARVQVNILDPIAVRKI